MLCKTGLHRSHQVKSVSVHAIKAFVMFGLRTLTGLPAFPRSSDREGEAFQGQTNGNGESNITACMNGEQVVFGIFMAFVLTALHGMQTRSSDDNSVRPSVRPSRCLSVKRVHCDKTEEKSAQIRLLWWPQWLNIDL